MNPRQPPSGNSPADNSASFAHEASFLAEIVETQNDLASIELDPSVIMQMVCERTQKLARADGAAVEIVEGNELVCRAGTGIMHPHEGMTFSLEASLVGRAVTTGQFQHARDSENDPRVDREATRKIGLRSLIVVPLLLDGKAIGVIVVASRRASAFEDRHIAALRLMAGLVVASLSHASEFEIKKQLLGERAKAIAALRESEQRSRNLFDHAADALFLHDLGGHFIDANVLACNNLGYSHAELLSKSVQEIEVDFDRARIAQHWTALESGKPVTINGKHRRRDGTIFSVEVRVMLVDHAGRKAILAIARDVSERIRVAAALRESQERFRSAFDHASIGMALVSPEGRWLQVNQSLCRIVGYHEHELLVTDFQSITYPDDLDADLASVKRLLAGEIVDYQMVKRYVHRQGHLVWVLLSVSLVRDASGNPAHFISQIQDITQRQNAEAALRASEDEYRATFEMAGVGKAQVDLNSGRFLRVNGKFCELTGYSADELQCTGFMQITHADDVASSHAALEQMRRGELSDLNMDKRYIRKDGSAMWVTLNATVLKDLSGRPARAVCTVQDITARKRAQWLESDRRHVLEMVALGLPLPEVLDQLAQAVERQIDGSLAAALVLQDGIVSLHGASLPQAWREALQLRALALTTSLSAGVWDALDGCGTTLIHSDPVWHELRAAAAEHGITACWTVAIRSTDGSSLGLLNVFCRQPRRPMAGDVQTLDMCAKLATICIDHHSATGQLSYLVKHDRLTGLPNRMMFEDRVQQALALAARSNKPMALMVLDIDKFKTINDTMGHQAGDQLLQQFAHRLESQLRDTDTMARIGGDEFVIVLPELTNQYGASVVAQKLVDSLNEPFDLGNKTIHATTSIGIALFPQDGTDAASLMKKADAALYRVKEKGRNGFSL